MVRIEGFHPLGRGSIPRIGTKKSRAFGLVKNKQHSLPDWRNWIARKTSKHKMRLNLEVGGSSPPSGKNVFTQQIHQVFIYKNQMKTANKEISSTFNKSG